MKAKHYLGMLCIPLLSACASHGSVAFNAKPDRVIDASAKARPDWLQQSNMGFVKGDMVYRIGATESTVDSSPRKLTEVASMKARADLAQELKTKIENRVQYASEGLGIEQETLERIVTMGSKLEKINGLRTHEVYWEKIATNDGYKDSVKYVAYALIGLDLKEYHRQLADAIRDNVDHSLSAKFQEKVDENYKEFFSKEPKVAESKGDASN